MTRIMNRLIRISGFLLMAALMTQSCDDIFEIDLSNRTVLLVAPADSVVVQSNNITFLWDTLSGANQYELQLASPNFSDVQVLLLDTVVSGYRYVTSISNGNYEWRLRALNSGYASQYSYRTFQVDTLFGNENQQVQLLLPVNEFVTGNEQISFVWEAFEGAGYYIFQILENERFTEITSGTSLEASITLYDSTLSWQVTAVCLETGSLKVSDYREFRIDKTPPSNVIVIAPEDNAQFDSLASIVLSWESVAEIDLQSYLVFLKDDNFNLITGYPEETKDLKFTVSSGRASLPKGTYHWVVLSKDKYGNISDSSSVKERSFTIK